MTGNPTRSHWLRALDFARPHRASIAVILPLTLSGGALQALEPLLFAWFFDAVAPPVDAGALVEVLVLLAALELTRELLTGLGNWLTWRTRIGIHQRILEVTVDRLQRLPLSFHRQKQIGETLTLVDRGIQGFVTALTEVSFSLMPAVVYLVVSFVVMVRLEPRLALLVALFAPLPAVVGVLAAPEQTRRERTLLHRWGRIYGRFHEVLGGILTVRSFGMEEVERQRFVRDVSDANRIVVRGVATDTSVGAVRNLLVTGARLAALGYGGWLIVHDQTTGGTVLAFIAYIGGLFGPVQGLTGVYQTIQRARVSLEAIFGILDVQDDPPDAAHPRPLAEVRGEVRFHGVTFCYEAGKPPALVDLDLHVCPGEQVALVGHSGAGKTTLVSLLKRLHDPTGGRVLLDGVDLRSLDQRALRREIGVVLQDGVLFNDTVRANIAYGRPEATLEQVREAARAANAESFIEALAHGYETVLGERGSLLSVGQRQRVAIARALLKDPPILVLDEATSALDAESEARVQDALERLMSGRTCFVIAHRLTTVVRAHRILVLQRGRIVEEGTHRELVQLGGIYADLVERQVSGLLAA